MVVNQLVKCATIPKLPYRPVEEEELGAEFWARS